VALVGRLMGAAVASERRRFRGDARPHVAVDRLNPGEVAALWGAAVPVIFEERADRWLEARAHRWGWGPLDPDRNVAAAVVSLDLARALPAGLPCPAWARFRGRSWAAGGYALVLPCYGPRGELVGLRARWTGAELPPADGADEINPAGPGALRGTVYACPVGRWLLSRGPEARRGDRPDPDAPDLRWDGRVLVVEGGPRWLRYAVEPGRARVADGAGWAGAVLGVFPGGWRTDATGRELAARMTGAELVTVATADPDDRTAAAAVATLKGAGARVGLVVTGGGTNGR